MRKRIWIIAAIFLAALFIPIPTGVCKDGGTRTYTALTYKITDWNRITGPVTTYDTTKIYWFPNNFKSIDTLWGYEEMEAEHSFTATVLEIYRGSVLVAPDPDEPIAKCCDKITFSTKRLPGLNLGAGTRLTITYKGGIMESYPAQIHATYWVPWEIATFSYEKDYALYHGDPGCKESGFMNVNITEAKTSDLAIKLARKECTVDYDSIAVAYDPDKRIYRVSFGKDDTVGGNQDVYINEDGITLLVVYGE